MRWAAAIVAFLLVGCGDAAGDRSPTITVFAASSLTELFEETARGRGPGVTVRLNFAGSPTLVRQLKEGASADVLATADQESMEQASRAGLLAGAPRRFATNRLEIVVPPGNPAGIGTLGDLARPGVKVALADAHVPAGRYARIALGKAAVPVNPVTNEESVRGVVSKVSLGEVDAGIVFVTDAATGVGRVDRVAIPDDLNVTASYFIAVVKGTRHPEAAAAFGPTPELLTQLGFGPP